MKTLTVLLDRHEAGVMLRRVIEDDTIRYVIVQDGQTSSEGVRLAPLHALEIADALYDDLGEDVEAVAFPAVPSGIPISAPHAIARPPRDQAQMMDDHLRRQGAIQIAALAYHLKEDHTVTGQTSAAEEAIDLVEEIEEQLRHREAIAEVAAGKRIFGEVELREAIVAVWAGYYPDSATEAAVAQGVADQVISRLWGQR